MHLLFTINNLWGDESVSTCILKHGSFCMTVQSVLGHLLDRSKPARYVCVYYCVWIVGFFHPSSCVCARSVLVHTVLLRCVSVGCGVCLNGLSPLVLPMHVYVCWHALTCCSIGAHPGDPPPPSSLLTCVYWADTQYPLTSCICRGGPCFCLSPWRPGMSSFLLHFL